jgi:hypothetical protein
MMSDGKGILQGLVAPFVEPHIETYFLFLIIFDKKPTNEAPI